MTVVLHPDTEGLGVMLGELVRANLEAHPERARYLMEDGSVNIEARDAEVEVGLRFGGGELYVGPPHASADLTISATSDVLLSLSNVPLRFGLPDSLTSDGRHVTAMLMNGTIKLRGFPRHVKLLARLNRLLSVR